MSKLKKWQLISATDVSPSPWFPIEKRVYQLPNGKIIDDFTVSTLADVAMIVPITTDQKIVLVKQYKPGVDEIFIQFPAGRMDDHHPQIELTAQLELEEEAGIKVKPAQLTFLGRLNGFSTKATEVVHAYLATDCQFNSTQHFDVTEEIEVLTVSVTQLEQMILNQEIWCSQTISAWWLAKHHLGWQVGW